MIYFHINIYQKETQMKTPEIQADPLLDLKAVQSAYKLNLHTIRTIVNDDTMPVTWLGKKRYLRQSDLEDYIAKHTKTSTTQTAQEQPVEALTKPVKRSPSKTTDATKKDTHQADSTHLLKALLHHHPNLRVTLNAVEQRCLKRR